MPYSDGARGQDLTLPSGMWYSYGMVPWLTMITCVLAALATFVLGFAGCGWSIMVPEDAVVVPLVLSPYALLTIMAWWRRKRRVASVVILAATFLVAAAGLLAFGTDAWRVQSEPHYGMAMRLTVIVVPVLQWVATVVLGVGLAVARAIARMREPSEER
jgi:hypothetical protein